MLDEAKLFIDNELVSSYKRHPMKFTVRSDDYGIGQHSIKAVAVGETGLEGEDEIQLSIVVATPIITPLPMTGLNETSVNFNGILVNDGGDEKTVCGICWSTSPEPSINSDHTELGSLKDTFQIQVSGLTPNTSYYAKFYSANESGISYGEEILFSTFVTANSAKDYDGNVYQLATIGDQVWMAENLKTTHYPNGDDLQLFTDMYMSYWPLDATQNKRIYCYYGNSEDNADTYGALYSWVTAVNARLSPDEQMAIVQGVCPTGFHVPSNKEWEELELYLGMTEEEVILKNVYRGEGLRGMLKDSSKLYWLDPNEGATNTSGFSALPGGYINYAGSFIGKGTQA